MDVDIWLGLWVAVIAGNAAIALVLLLRLREHLVAAAAVVGWLVADVALALTGVFAGSPDRSFPVIAVGLLTPIVVGTALVARRGRTRSFVERLPLPWLIGVQVYRVIGVVFVVA